jgi:hypothetical protein
MDKQMILTRWLILSKVCQFFYVNDQVWFLGDGVQVN